MFSVIDVIFWLRVVLPFCQKQRLACVRHDAALWGPRGYSEWQRRPRGVEESVDCGRVTVGRVWGRVPVGYAL